MTKMVKPVASGLPARWLLRARAKPGQSRHSSDHRARHPHRYVAIVTAVCMLPIGWVLGYFANTSGPARIYRRHHRRRRLCPLDEFLRLPPLWLHGRLDRFVRTARSQASVSCRDRRGFAPCHFWRRLVWAMRDETVNMKPYVLAEENKRY